MTMTILTKKLQIIINVITFYLNNAYNIYIQNDSFIVQNSLLKNPLTLLKIFFYIIFNIFCRFFF